MDLNVPGSDPPSNDPTQTRSFLTIDLNQIPSPASETLPSPSCSLPPPSLPPPPPLSPTSLVRWCHENPPLAEGLPGEIPGEGRPAPCAACGLPELPALVLVCDACERPFHLVCVGVTLPSDPGDEWLCRDCVAAGIGSRRWPLGRKRVAGAVRLLDINASPPSDGDGDGPGNGDLEDLSKHSLDDHPFGGYPNVASLSHSNFLYSGNRLDAQNTTAIFAHVMSPGVEAYLRQNHSGSRSSREIDLTSQLERRRSRKTTIRLPSRGCSELLLQSLREFISERQGVLGEGWSVEYKQSEGCPQIHTVYCSPDGKILETMSDVAHYLGLSSSVNSTKPEVRIDVGSSLFHKDMNHLKSKKSQNLPIANGYQHNNNITMVGSGKEIFSNVQNGKNCVAEFGLNHAITGSGSEENCGTDSQQFNDGLPIQYEDFFLLSTGEVDARSSYHDACHIWPVGYRSCWHDKVTGSLFLCNVVDGGDEGPLFKIRRFSCSSLPIPYGSTILSRKKIGSSIDGGDKITSFNSTYDEDCGIETLLSEPLLPQDTDVLSWLGSSSHSTHHVRPEPNLLIRDSSPYGAQQSACGSNSFVGDKIDEFSIDGTSSSVVWGICSQKLIDACRQLYQQTGSLTFFCKHAEDGASSFCYNDVDVNNREIFSGLDKFCSLLCPSNIPRIVTADQEFELAAELLKNWMNQDRFGLDVEFIQEFIERIPSVNSCSQYKVLKCRRDYSVTPLVGNGLLVSAKSICSHVRQDERLDNSGRGSRRKSESLLAENLSFSGRCLPPGKLLGSKHPPRLVGDVIQAWELLLHFQDVLGLDMAFSFSELEAELINPWDVDLSCLEPLERDLEDAQRVTSDASKDQSGPTSSSSSEIDTCKQNSYIFIEIGTAKMKQEADVRLASSTYSRCTGVVLRKTHISLLNVLVSELLLKVGSVLDPMDGGEFKPRRSRRKDVDNSNLAKRAKLIMLPINELTWPELARRYLLSVLCAGGSSDLSEATIRESGKIYRCLQGDGGVLCGSLSGIAATEADALLLAEAKKQIYGSLNIVHHLTIEAVDADAPAPVSMDISDGTIPDWACELQPVPTLPTNVGTRIRNCVYAALKKEPPEWAKSILEHSISKAVYKGNASGPTKKAVISLLAMVTGEGLPRKPPRDQKKKKVLSVSDIITRQCRILLRRVASADNDKALCNLVGRNMMNSSDNDDEGLIGCPGMLSRPLDFRTIDMRLAMGAYGGLHESFLEDVRELWSNFRAASADRADMLQLIDTLSQNFDSLYEKEVIPLVEKLKEYMEKECIDSKEMKEIDDIVALTIDIPKAPWDDGVCKVCGIDKDDDSVLLCDNCDAEYHTYCLNPPLARIPDGNWYCPACTEGPPKCSQMLNQHRQKKFQGDVIRGYLEELTSLAAAMEEKEYWEFSVHERTLLLKFLCDELLNSSVIHQHLERCAEVSADLQQKLRSLYSEIKILKSREDLLAIRAAKANQNVHTVAGEVNIGVQPLSTIRPMLLLGSSSEDGQKADVASEQLRESHDHSNDGDAENNSSCIGHNKKPGGDSGSNIEDNDDSEFHGNHINDRPRKRLKSEILSSPLMLEINGVVGEGSPSGSRNPESTQGDASVFPSADGQTTVSPSSGLGCAELVGSAPLSLPLSESQALNLELTSLRKDISALQQSISDMETQLLKASIRMEFLGSDSAGRLYWLSAKPGEYPSVLVDGTLSLQRGKEKPVRSFPPPEMENPSNLGSNSSCPFVLESSGCAPDCSQWTSYESDSEVKALLQWLRDDDPKEKELKDSIMHWQKLKFCASIQAGKLDQVEPLEAGRSEEKMDNFNCPVTKATTLLEKKHGPFMAVSSDNSRRLRKKSKTGDENFYRCNCLEPVWISRHHCICCHGTFITAAELEKHNNDGCCSSTGPTSVKRKETSDLSTGQANFEVRFREDSHAVGTSQSTTSEIGSRLIKFQNDAWICPYKLEDISSKFVTNDSIKDLVQHIGLIGTDGRPSMVSSVLPHFSDPKLAFSLLCGDRILSSEVGASSQHDIEMSEDFAGRGSGASFRYFEKDASVENSKVDQSSLEIQKLGKKKAVSDTWGLSSEAGQVCIVKESSLWPLVGRAAEILKQLKISLLDIDAALPDEALKPSRADVDKRLAWRAFVKGAENIFEMVQASIVLEDMIKAEYLRSEWYYWSSLSAAIRTSTLSALALRIYALDNAIVYDRTTASASASLPTPSVNAKSSSEAEQPQPQPQPQQHAESSEKPRLTRRASRKRKESDG